MPRVLLQILALEPVGRTAGELMGYVWSDLHPDRGRKRLYGVMSRLRATRGRGSARASDAPDGGLSARGRPIETYGIGYWLSDIVRVGLRLANEQISRFRSLFGTERSKALESGLDEDALEAFTRVL